jgi:hypothetical protein
VRRIAAAPTYPPSSAVPRRATRQPGTVQLFPWSGRLEPAGQAFCWTESRSSRPPTSLLRGATPVAGGFDWRCRLRPACPHGLPLGSFGAESPQVACPHSLPLGSFGAEGPQAARPHSLPLGSFGAEGPGRRALTACHWVRSAPKAPGGAPSQLTIGFVRRRSPRAECPHSLPLGLFRAEGSGRRALTACHWVRSAPKPPGGAPSQLAIGFVRRCDLPGRFSVCHCVKFAGNWHGFFEAIWHHLPMNGSPDGEPAWTLRRQ